MTESPSKVIEWRILCLFHFPPFIFMPITVCFHPAPVTTILPLSVHARYLLNDIVAVGASAFSLHNLPFVATQPMEAQQYLSFLMVVPYLTIYIVTRPADGVKRKAYGSPMRSWRYLALSRENECAGP